MAIKLSLSSKQILNKVFREQTPGYNPLEVDEFLDSVLRDYRTIEENCLIAKRELSELQSKVERLEKENETLELENIKYKARYENLDPSMNVTKDNLELIKRIDTLERYLYEHNIDPTKIK